MQLDVSPELGLTDPATASPLQALLGRASTRPNANMPAAGAIVIGHLKALAADGQPMVTWDAGPATPMQAASLVAVSASDVGRPVAISFAGETTQPLLLGFVWTPTPVATPTEKLSAEVDGQPVEITAEHALTLRCGKASITLTADGQVLLRGSYVSSHSTGTQRIKGAAVRIN